MTMLIGQMLGCLLVAAGIGGAIGWLLRHFAFGSRQAQGTGDRSSLPLTSQALEKLQQELNLKVSETQALEEKMVASNALRQSTEQQLAVQQEHVRALREELAATKQQVLEHETARDAWSNTYAQAVQRATDEAARSQDLRTEVDELQDRLTIQEQELSEKTSSLRSNPRSSAKKRQRSIASGSNGSKSKPRSGLEQRAAISSAYKSACPIPQQRRRQRASRNDVRCDPQRI